METESSTGNFFFNYNKITQNLKTSIYLRYLFCFQNGSIVAPASVSPLLVLAAYGMGHGEEIEGSMSFLMGLSYLRYGIVAITNSLYGHNRPILNCPGSETEYCHYKDPKLLLRDLGMADTTTLGQILALFAFAVVYRFVAYLALRYRLTSEFSIQVLNYIAKILRYKWGLFLSLIRKLHSGVQIVRYLDTRKKLSIIVKCIFYHILLLEKS